MLIITQLTFYLCKYHLYDYNKPKYIYKSNNFIVINKPFDLKINSNNANEYTIQTYLQYAIPEYINSSLYHQFYFAHRLDYATSGILCIPLNKMACKIASKGFELRNTKKYYIAILRGIVSDEMFFVNQGIGENKHETNIQKMCTSDNKNCVKAKQATTTFLALETGIYENYYCTKVLIRTITGRRHQIRVHCSYLGHTIIGDYTYSNKKDLKPFRMFLHSFRLILPNELENLDVQTTDPFSTDKLINWSTIKVINELSDEAFAKIDQLASTI